MCNVSSGDQLRKVGGLCMVSWSKITGSCAIILDKMATKSSWENVEGS